jgi:NAD(P)-dependent dehydrogenase (short-subunit alcohol dehydrogenase family)
MNINCRVHFQLISMAAPFLKLSKGCVVVLSDTAGITPLPGAIIQSTAAAMLNMLVQCSALETAFHGMRVNAVAPGITNTSARKKKKDEGSLELGDRDNKTFMDEAK